MGKGFFKSFLLFTYTFLRLESEWKTSYQLGSQVISL